MGSLEHPTELDLVGNPDTHARCKADPKSRAGITEIDNAQSRAKYLGSLPYQTQR
jgi:hypothetical protein